MTIALYPEEAVIVGSTITYSADEITLHLTGTMFGLKAGIGTPHQFLRMNSGGTEAAWETVTVATTSAKYILQQADGSLPSAQSLGALTTGLLKNTVTGTTGVLSTAVSGTDYITSITAGTGLQSTGGGTPTLSISPSVVSSVTTNQSGSTFSASISSNLLTISLPDASLVNRGVWTTGTQSLRGDKQLLGSWEIFNNTTADPVLKCVGNYNAGDVNISTFYSPHLADQYSVKNRVGYQNASNDELVTSFTKISTGSIFNYSLLSINSDNFGSHTTSASMRFGYTGSGDQRGFGRSGVDGIDTAFPSFEFTSESASAFPCVNYSSNVYGDGSVCGFQAYSTYHADITDGVHAAAAIYATADLIDGGGHLHGSLWINVNQGGSLNPVFKLQSDGTVYTPTITNGDQLITLDGYDQACLACYYNWEPNATPGPFVTGADKFSSWWQRVGNIVTCYVKWKVSVNNVNAGDMIQWYCDLPSNITGISLANTEDVCGHVTFFKTPCFNSGTVIAEDNQHVQFSVMCLQSVVNDTYQVTSSWSYFINP